MPTALYLCRAPEGAGPLNKWEKMLASPLGTAESVKAGFEQLWPGLRWTFGSGIWSAIGEDPAGKRHIEASISNTLEGLCYFIVLRATPPSVIRQTMEMLDLNYVCDPEAGCLVDPFAYGDSDRYYAKKQENRMGYQAINFKQKFGLFSEQWQPKVVAEMNDYQLKVVKLQGDFIWHDHKDTDETFIVVEGKLRIDFRDGFVHVGTGEMFVVPKGVEHKPYAEHEVRLLLIEPRGVLNTGHEGGERTAVNDVWI